MSTVHLAPDSLCLPTRALVQDYSHLSEALFTLRVQYYRLEMVWQGGEAQEFLNKFQQMLHGLETRLDEIRRKYVVDSFANDCGDICTGKRTYQDH